MTQPLPDPSRWLTDLMTSEHAVLWPSGDVADTSKALEAAAAPWTSAVAEFTKWQLSGIQAMTQAWTAAFPAMSAAANPTKDKRFAGEAWTKDPRYDALARTYPAQTDLMRKALDAAPLDERSKAQWGFALGSGSEALE